MTRTMDDMFLELYKEENLLQESECSDAQSLTVFHQNINRIMEEIEARKEELKSQCGM